MNIQVSTIALLVGLLPASSLLAEGGKVQEQNPVFGENCVETSPPGINLETCESVPAPPQSGVEVFFCEGTRVIVCNTEEED